MEFWVIVLIVLGVLFVWSLTPSGRQAQREHNERAKQILTGGWSMLATGLSRKEAANVMACTNCQTVWYA